MVALMSVSSIVSAATGSTSTGSTSTGVILTGSLTPGVSKGAGWPTRAYNFTTKAYDMYPACYPWVWTVDYFRGNIFDMYKNQEICRAQRTIDFGF